MKRTSEAAWGLPNAFRYPELEPAPRFGLIIPKPTADAIQLFSRQFGLVDFSLLSFHVRLLLSWEGPSPSGGSWSTRRGSFAQ
jgi:hypothetical protein